MSAAEAKAPSGWIAVALGEVAEINPPLDRCLLDDQMPVTFVPMRAIGNEGAGLLRPESRRYEEVKKGYTPFLTGDVISAKITPCMENGKTTVVPDVPGQVCFGSTEFHVVRPERGLQAQWVAQFLLQHETRRVAQRQMGGAVGQMRVPAVFLEALTLPLAPCAEQARIVEAIDELLSDLDAGVAALHRVRAKLDLYRASVLKAAVEGSLTTAWRARHPDAVPASTLLESILVERRCNWEDEQLAKFSAKRVEPPKNWKQRYQAASVPDTANLYELPNRWCWATVEQAGAVRLGRHEPPSTTTARTCAPTCEWRTFSRIASTSRMSRR